MSNLNFFSNKFLYPINLIFGTRIPKTTSYSILGMAFSSHKNVFKQDNLFTQYFVFPVLTLTRLFNSGLALIDVVNCHSCFFYEYLLKITVTKPKHWHP